MKHKNLIVLTTSILAVVHVSIGVTQEATDTFEATVTVVEAEPTCTFSVESVDFGTLEENVDVPDGTRTDFDIDFDCSEAVEAATISFEDDNHGLGSPNAWVMYTADGTAALPVFIRNELGVGNPVSFDRPITLSAGVQTLTYSAEISQGSGQPPTAGVYSTSIDVIATF